MLIKVYNYWITLKLFPKYQNHPPKSLILFLWEKMVIFEDSFVFFGEKSEFSGKI